MATTKSKLRTRATKPRQRSREEREKLGKDMLSKNRDRRLRELERVLLLLEPHDFKWLNEAVAEIKYERRRTSRNELIRVGISLAKEKSREELLALLRQLD
jgi:hypothetical protein